MNLITKLLWIKSLDELANQYATEIKHNISHNTLNCNLCKTARMIKDEGNCNVCIHLNTTFGQGIVCSSQQSFHYEHPDLLNWMPWRRSYILRIKNKLIESL